MKLTPAEAAALYREGRSACEIAAAHGITRQGAEARIRAAGLGGVHWCRIHRTYEELRVSNAEAVAYMAAPGRPARRWVQPSLEAS